MCSRGAEFTPHFFWIIPDYSWLFLIIPIDSRDTSFPIIADYSISVLIIQIIRIIPIIAKLWKYSMLVFPLTCAVAEVPDEDDIPHAQEVLSLPPQNTAIPDAHPPAWLKRLCMMMLFYSLDYCDHCNDSVYCDYWNYQKLFRLLQSTILNNRNNLNTSNNPINLNNPLASCHYFSSTIWIIQIIQTILRIAIIVMI